MKFFNERLETRRYKPEIEQPLHLKHDKKIGLETKPHLPQTRPVLKRSNV